MTINNQQERSTLNDGIEERYLLASDYAGNIINFYENKRGALKDEYENFFLYFTRLVIITAPLEELSKEKDTVKKIKNWIRNKEREPNLDRRCESGIEMFESYQDLLSTKGLLSLPSRGR